MMMNELRVHTLEVARAEAVPHVSRTTPFFFQKRGVNRADCMCWVGSESLIPVIETVEGIHFNGTAIVD
jgi:hypothetical protein